MKIEFLICGSLTDAFCSQIAFFRLCLDNLGVDYKRAALIVTFGNHSEEKLPEKWIKYFKNIKIYWSHSIGEENADFSLQHYKRFEVIDLDCDLSIICDADTALMRPIPEILDSIQSNPALLGVIAHYHVPKPVSWNEMSLAILDKSIELKYRYTLEDANSELKTPFYINYGFFAGPPKLMKKFYKRDKELIEPIGNLIGRYWGPQVGVALTIEDLKIPHKALSMKYNFPNDPIADKLYPSEMNDIRLIHYLRQDSFDRQKIFVNEEEFNFFLNLKLEGSNLIFQSFVFKLTNGVYPFK